MTNITCIEVFLVWIEEWKKSSLKLFDSFRRYGMEFQLYRAFNLTTALRDMLLSAKSEDNETVALVAAFRP